MKKHCIVIGLLVSFLLPQSGFAIGNIMTQRVVGKIVLQVQENGEAWYVNPADHKRYYLRRPQEAYGIMRVLGVGITNTDIAKIPVGDLNLGGLDSDGDGLADRLEVAFNGHPLKADTDGDGYTDKMEVLNGYPVNAPHQQKLFDTAFAQKHAGKIFLQVEKNGEAWYVNPGDFKRYYLGDGYSAFSLMRRFGLGISNNDLAQVPIGETPAFEIRDVIVRAPVVPVPDTVAPVPAPVEEPVITQPIEEPMVEIPDEDVLIPQEQNDISEEPSLVRPTLPTKQYLTISKTVNFAQHAEPAIVPPVTLTFPELEKYSVSDCGVFSSPGIYEVTNDITFNKSSYFLDSGCLHFSDTTNVILDCKNYDINVVDPELWQAFLYMKGVSNFKVMNCDSNSFFRFDTVSRGIFSENIFEGLSMTSQISNANYVDIINNVGGNVGCKNCNYTRVVGNTLTNNISRFIIPAVIVFSPGEINDGQIMNRYNVVKDNIVDGRWDGVVFNNWKDNIGADDGIVIDGQEYMRVENNVFKNSWDCGIEGVGNVFDSLIASNTIENNFICGIGAWHWSNWKRNLVRDNYVTESNRGLVFFRSFPELRQYDDGIYFVDNQFIANTFENFVSRQNYTDPYSAFFSFNKERYLQHTPSPDTTLPSLDQIYIHNNILQGNSMGDALVEMTPFEAFFDGGGNDCSMDSEYVAYSLCD